MVTTRSTPEGHDPLYPPARSGYMMNKGLIVVCVLIGLLLLGAIKFNIGPMPPRHPITNDHSTYVSMPYNALTTVEHDGHRFIVFETTHGVGMILHPDDPAAKAR